MSEDGIFLLHALFTGVFIAFVYDGWIIFRRVIPHKGFVESLEDLVFWIFCAVYVFLWLYRESNGTLRWFAVMGALSGMILYKRTISSLWVKGAVWFLNHVIRLIRRCFSFLWKPIHFLWKRGNAQRRKLVARRRKIQGNLKIWLKSYAKALKIKLTKR